MTGNPKKVKRDFYLTSKFSFENKVLPHSILSFSYIAYDSYSTQDKKKQHWSQSSNAVSGNASYFAVKVKSALAAPSPTVTSWVDSPT